MDRRSNRRQMLDRRVQQGEWPGVERRRGLRRVRPDRRHDEPNLFWREEELRIRHFLKGRDGKLSEGRMGISCPRCAGYLLLRSPVQWKGGVSVFEVRCTNCPRRMYWKT